MPLQTSPFCLPGGLSGRLWDAAIRTGRQDKTCSCVQAGVTQPRKEKRRFSTQSPSFGLPWEVSHNLVFTYEHEMSSKRERVSVQNHCYRPPRVPAPGFQQQRAQLPFQVTSSATTYHRPVLNTRFAHESTCGYRAPRAPATRTCARALREGRRRHGHTTRCLQAGAQRSASRHSTSVGLLGNEEQFQAVHNEKVSINICCACS